MNSEVGIIVGTILKNRRNDMENKQNIYQRINSIMDQCGYLQKTQIQQGKGIKYDEVIAMLRPLLIKHGIVMVIRQTCMRCLNSVEGTKQKIYEGYYEMDLINIDNPTEKVTHTVYAHGMDGGDKAPGKAHTYAVKTMLVKGFGIETGIDEESRSEKIERLNTIDADRQNELIELIAKDGVLNNIILKAYNINSVAELSIGKFEEVKSRIKNYMSKKEAKQRSDDDENN